MGVINKHGLSRDIPLDIKRDIRQRCGFGCVFCGLFLTEIEHIDPPFVDAKEHDPNCMCLLCPNHHTKKGSVGFTVDDIKRAYANPRAKQRDFTHDKEFLFFTRPTTIKLGNWTFNDPREILKVGDETLLALEDLDDGHIALTGRFYDSSSNLILNVDKNELKISSGNWDVRRVKNGFIINEAANKICLHATINSRNELLFTNVKMRYGQVYFRSRLGRETEVYFGDRRIFEHVPESKGAGGISTDGYFEISADGSTTSIKGNTVVHAGKMRFGEG